MIRRNAALGITIAWPGSLPIRTTRDTTNTSPPSPLSLSVCFKAGRHPRLRPLSVGRPSFWSIPLSHALASYTLEQALIPFVVNLIITSGQVLVLLPSLSCFLALSMRLQTSALDDTQHDVDAAILRWGRRVRSLSSTTASLTVHRGILRPPKSV